MYRKRFVLIALIGLLSIVLVSSGGLAQGQPPPRDPEPPYRNKDQTHPIKVRNPRHGSEKEWDAPERLEKIQAPLNSEDTGGPDDFGYTWDDAVGINWVDVTDGTDTGMSGSSWDQAIGPIPLPFPFKYYGESYDQVWIAASGYLAFTESWYWPEQQAALPAVEIPNNVVAPFWTVIQLQNNGPSGRVYYKSGGTSPNRYYVVEWYDVNGGTASDPSGGDEVYRFEVILYENGDIVFQYHTMIYNDWRYYASIGIEDTLGEGLGYMDWGNYWDRIPSSNQAIRYYYPQSARVSLSPHHQGSFTSSGDTITYELSVRNNGDLGTDNYSLAVASDWLTSLYTADGTTPITDTGPMAQGMSKTIIVKVQVPQITNVGDGNIASITATSSINPAKSKTATMEASIPSPFAQVFSDDADGSMSIYLVQPHSQVIKKASPDDHLGFDMAVAETPGFAYVWSHDEWTGELGRQEIEYTLLDDSGDVDRMVSKLTNHSGATMSTWDYNPTVAVAPNGNIGVIWVRELYNASSEDNNDNVWIAILNPSGDVVYEPANLTNNNVWGSWDDTEVPWFYQPVIAVTGDSHFILSWTKDYESGGGCSGDCSVTDVYYTIRDSTGSEIKPVTPLTYDGPDQHQMHDDSNLTPLSGNRALLTWECYDNINYDWDICYVVLDSGGNLLKDITKASDTYNSSFNVDAVQLSDGKSVITWHENDRGDDKLKIAYVILDASYNVITSPTLLSHPAAVTGNNSPSVAASGDRAVLSWMDLGAVLSWMDLDWKYRHHLYYALVDSNGSVLSEPMIFLSSQDEENPNIETSFVGYGNTTYTITPTSPLVDVYILTPSRVGTSPGGVGTVPVSFGNNGATTATSVVITATLDTQLNYIGDTSGIVPIVDGNELTWNLPTDLSFLGNGQFSLRVSAPDAPYGSLYPLMLGISSDGPEGAPIDNTASVSIMIARQIYLPSILRNDRE